jgi:hypothetical protein
MNRNGITRRDFLTVATAAAGSALLCSHSASAEQGSFLSQADASQRSPSDIRAVEHAEPLRSLAYTVRARSVVILVRP